MCLGAKLPRQPKPCRQIRMKAGSTTKKKLRVQGWLNLEFRRGAHFLNVGVDNQVTWPREATRVKFDRYELIMMPKTKDNVQSVHIDLTGNRLALNDAKSIIARFLSILSWCSDNYAVMQDGWSGNPIPVPVPKRNLAFTTTSDWNFDRRIPATDEI